jgi:hypothetical protein
MNPAKLALVVRHEHGAERQRVGSDEGLGRPKANPKVYILSDLRSSPLSPKRLE